MTFTLHCDPKDVGCLDTGLCDIVHGYMKDIHYAGCVCHTSRITKFASNGIDFTCPWDQMLTIVVLICVICALIATPILMKWYKYVELIIAEEERIESTNSSDQVKDQEA